MGDIIDKVNELENGLMNTDYSPVELPKMDFSDRNYREIPVAEISALGTIFSPLMDTFNTVTTTFEGGEPLLRMVNGSIDELFKLKDGSGLVRGFVHNGSEFTKNGIFEVVENATETVTTTIPYNPAMLFMAIALVNIDKKLGNIEETQKKILNRFEIIDRAELQGDLNLLYEILDDYKYCWDNEKIKTENLGIVKHIKKDTTAKIAQYETILNDEIIKNKLIHFNKDLDRSFSEVYRNFTHYQLAIYEYAFSSFLEVMLSEYFDEKYLNNVIKWINDYSFKYRQTYTKCYDILKPYADKSVEAIALDGLGKAGRKVGETIGKLPFADKISIDEGLVSLGNKIDAFGDRKASETMKAFAEMRDANVTSFVDQIETLNKMHNQPNIYDYLVNNANGRNIQQWCKQKACWDSIKSEVNVELSHETKKVVLSKKAIVDYENDSSSTSKSSEDILIEDLMQISADVWGSISSWGKETGSLASFQNGISYSLAKQKRKGSIMSYKQARQGIKILNVACETGFVNDEFIKTLLNKYQELLN